MEGETGITIPGTDFKLPTWALVVGGVGFAVLLFLRKPASSSEEEVSGTGLLSEEINTRLSEMWERWLEWANQYMDDSGSGPIDDIGDPEPPGDGEPPTTEPPTDGENPEPPGFIGPPVSPPDEPPGSQPPVTPPLTPPDEPPGYTPPPPPPTNPPPGTEPGPGEPEEPETPGTISVPGISIPQFPGGGYTPPVLVPDFSRLISGGGVSNS